VAERIAILFGIPTSPAAFSGRATSKEWDYGKRLFARRPTADVFETVYAPVCAAARELIGRAKRTSVSVYETTTIEDLGSACAAHDVVVLIAHWRGSRVDPGDVLDGCGEAILRATDGPLRCVADMRASCATRDAAAVLNRAIESDALLGYLPHGIGREVAVTTPVLETLLRDVLDASLDGYLKPGNRLELDDGLHSLGEVCEAIPPAFAGVLDLSCCTSSVLGTYLRMARGSTFDIVMSDALVVPTPHMRLVDATLELVATDPGAAYAPSRRLLARALDDRYKTSPGRNPCP
jgi:hypothetical protein